MVKDLCFEIIEKCLNNCMFCSSNSNCNKTQIIRFEDFKRTIDYFMANGGIEELSLSGGEPFLHPELIKMVDYSKSLGIRTVIFTSGVTNNLGLSQAEKTIIIDELNRRLQEINANEPDNEFLKHKVINFYKKILNPSYFTSISKELLLELQKIGLDKIVFDYQAYEYETDNMLMGRKEESRLSLLKSLITASLIGLEVDVHFVPMKLNYKEIGDILEMLEIAEVKNISILNFLPQGRGKINQNDLQLSDEEIKEFFELLEKHKQSYSGNIRIGIPLQGEDTHKCNAGLEKLDIKFDGTVLPCPAFKEITPEECERFNIKLPNIYINLEEVVIPGKGTRVKPLCKQIYSSRTKIFSSFSLYKTRMHKRMSPHGDYDHMGEAINLVNNFKVEKVIFNCGEYNDLEKDLIKVLDNKKIKYYSCIKELNIDKNKLYFLQTKEYDNENDNSNVIYTELDGYKFMFMGDASITTEKEILSKYNLSDIDVLKVGHHGSKTSSGKDFINEINPKYSIISVGKNNRYGHPKKEVLYNLNNSKIYRTDQDGSIMFKIKNNKLKIETCSP